MTHTHTQCTVCANSEYASNACIIYIVNLNLYGYLVMYNNMLCLCPLWREGKRECVVKCIINVLS